MEKKSIWIIVSLIICGLILLVFGPLDIFFHGFYPNEIDVGQIADIDKIGQIKVNDDNCSIVFSPQQDHFAGVELYLVNHFPKNGGIMTMLISDSNGKQIDDVKIDLSKVKDSSWYKIYINASLKKGNQYSARFIMSGTDSIPSFMIVNHDYLGDESITGDILISYAYGKSTFSFPEKVILSMLIIALLGIVLFYQIENERYRSVLKIVILFLVLTSGMTWNYMYNSFDNSNSGFYGFQSDSETYATGVIYAEHDEICFRNKMEQGYNLGRYYDLKGCLRRYDLSYISDDNWLNGYNRKIPAIIVNSNLIIKKIAVAGNYIKFKNGEEYQITKITDDGSNIIITLNTDRTLSNARNGSLDGTVFFDVNHQALPKSLITAYKSQYGLQGKIFRYMARFMKEIENLHLISSLATASIFVVIVFLLAYKFNPLFAGCFYVTFVLSPWVVNFARNLYWVEFTWFIPMAIGLMCSIKVESKKWRIGCYIATFVAIVAKCLCGYEYISTVMMGLVSFMVVDLLLAFVKKDKEKIKLLFRTTFILGIIALAGFIVAICIHAPLRSGGNLTEGISMIIKEDVLRRTNGADLNNFNPIYWSSMNASMWEVCCKYFNFKTDIITGVTGNLFPILCIVPIVIFIYEYRYKRKIDFQSIFMYAFFFLTSISWFCLAKSHSYIHTHINYVLWYFGFVQICFYVIISRIQNGFQERKVNTDIMHHKISVQQENKTKEEQK